MNRYEKHLEICKKIVKHETVFSYEFLFSYWEYVKYLATKKCVDENEYNGNQIKIRDSLKAFARCAIYLYRQELKDESITYDDIVKELNQVYIDKNTIYGNSFGKLFKELGIVSALVRMSDKVNRIESLINGVENRVTDERLVDSLKDLSNYACMSLLEMDVND